MKNILLREKVVLLRTGKMVKIVRREHIETISQKTDNRVDVFVRELDQDTFSPFLNVSHPKYYKFINHLPRPSVILQLRYSGLSKKEIALIIEEFI
ncbi:hypothetical protein [Dyadobacter sp. 3J3]|uniref:hypothetical protein n=1 Tax=Dyadobacter sp. 3J3 TaxID=2606600 RepID=UPI00135C5067|nr:hypothetical protein [Dyadobacter sp. 3J3]